MRSCCLQTCHEKRLRSWWHDKVLCLSAISSWGWITDHSCCEWGLRQIISSQRCHQSSWCRLWWWSTHSIRIEVKSYAKTSSEKKKLCILTVCSMQDSRCLFAFGTHIELSSAYLFLQKTHTKSCLLVLLHMSSISRIIELFIPPRNTYWGL